MVEGSHYSQRTDTSSIPGPILFLMIVFGVCATIGSLIWAFIEPIIVPSSTKTDAEMQDEIFWEQQKKSDEWADEMERHIEEEKERQRLEWSY